MFQVKNVACVPERSFSTDQRRYTIVFKKGKSTIPNGWYWLPLMLFAKIKLSTFWYIHKIIFNGKSFIIPYIVIAVPFVFSENCLLYYPKIAYMPILPMREVFILNCNKYKTFPNFQFRYPQSGRKNKFSFERFYVLPPFAEK